MRKLKLNELGRHSIQSFKQIAKSNLIVVLDNVRSMHNVGSIFRTSDAFLVKELVLCGITPTPPHRDITKTAIGAENSVNWRYEPNIETVLNAFKTANFTIIALEQTINSKVLTTFDFDDNTVLVLGNEVDGVSDQALAYCHAALEIPQLGTKHSLNVSVSAGIAIWSYAHQHLFLK